MGSLKVKSCLTNLLSFYRAVYEPANKVLNYDIIYLDFSKAFDRMPHQKLLTRIKAHGIDGRVYNWNKALLIGREERVQVNGYKSNWGTVNSKSPSKGPYLAHYFSLSI